MTGSGNLGIQKYEGSWDHSRGDGSTRKVGAEVELISDKVCKEETALTRPQQGRLGIRTSVCG